MIPTQLHGASMTKRNNERSETRVAERRFTFFGSRMRARDPGARERSSLPADNGRSNKIRDHVHCLYDEKSTFVVGRGLNRVMIPTPERLVMQDAGYTMENTDKQAMCQSS